MNTACSAIYCILGHVDPNCMDLNEDLNKVPIVSACFFLHLHNKGERIVHFDGQYLASGSNG